MNWTTKDVKAIRESLKTQPAYLNRSKPRMSQAQRTRVYDARCHRDGTLEVKLLSQNRNTANNRLIGSGLCWVPLEAGDSISIYGGTPMEEVLVGGI